MISLIISALSIALISAVTTLIIEGILYLATYVVDYFKGLRLRKGRDIPFIANKNHKQIREMINKAPKKNVGIFEGTYNEETDEIENLRDIEADQLGDDVKDVLENEPLVVLS